MQGKRTEAYLTDRLHRQSALVVRPVHCCREQWSSSQLNALTPPLAVHDSIPSVTIRVKWREARESGCVRQINCGTIIIGIIPTHHASSRQASIEGWDDPVDPCHYQRSCTYDKSTHKIKRNKRFLNTSSDMALPTYPRRMPECSSPSCRSVFSPTLSSAWQPPSPLPRPQRSGNASSPARGLREKSASVIAACYLIHGVQQQTQIATQKTRTKR